MKNRYFKNVVSLKLDKSRCVGCRRCLEVCPHLVFELFEGQSQIRDKDACMECGACAMNCPTDAITVKTGVGCASAILKSIFTGSEPSCDCDSGHESDSSCC